MAAYLAYVCVHAHSLPTRRWITQNGTNNQLIENDQDLSDYLNFENSRVATFSLMVPSILTGRRQQIKPTYVLPAAQPHWHESDRILMLSLTM